MTAGPLSPRRSTASLRNVARCSTPSASVVILNILLCLLSLQSSRGSVFKQAHGAVLKEPESEFFWSGVDVNGYVAVVRKTTRADNQRINGVQAFGQGLIGHLYVIVVQVHVKLTVDLINDLGRSNVAIEFEPYVRFIDWCVFTQDDIDIQTTV
ncbi:hypothetical protein D3C75_842120 [compost metagenome]